MRERLAFRGESAILSAMTAIRELPQEEVEKIAAGEVVERPVSVVKELMENALDAGAHRIEVEIADGGKQLIRVTDDGEGIPADELPLAVKNFHTSKIQACEDIYHQTTLGFRGEALAAIAAVSRFTIASRNIREDLGARLEVDGGKLLSHRPETLNAGTIVEVRELFFNTPVRQKFMRSRATETHHIAALMRSYVLAFPEVAFSLVGEGRKLIASRGQGLAQEELGSVFGKELAGLMRSFRREYPPLAVSGLIAPPSTFKAERGKQFFFVNRRPVKNRVLFRAVDDAVREYVSPDRYPALALMLEIPPEEVDVNIHPTKSEVSFMHQQQVYAAIVVALKDVLTEVAAVRQAEGREKLGFVQAPHEGAERETGTEAGTVELPLYEMGEPLVMAPAEPGGSELEAREMQFPASRPELSVLDSRAGSLINLTKELELPAYLDPAGHYFACQVAATYILLVRRDEILLIDQHSAHERILFERLWKRLGPDAEGEVERQPLLFPLDIELTSDESERYSERLELMRGLGFVARLSETALIVEEVPRLLLVRELEVRIPAILAELVDFDRSRLMDEERKELLATLACHSAIRAGDRLRPMEIMLLVEGLVSQADSTSCPHGRPTVVRLTAEDMARMFRRG